MSNPTTETTLAANAAVTITEADVVAFLKAKAEELGKEFPELKVLRLSVHADGSSTPFFIRGEFSESSCSGESASGASVEEAARKLRSRLPSVIKLAEQKRAQAAQLLAEADKLTTAKAA